MSNALIVVAGPTGSGKSELAMSLCDIFGVFEIVSADSVQIYRYMDIGSGKVSIVEREKYPHFCIDIVEPDVDFDVSAYLECAVSAIRQIHSRGRIPIVVGGTGMYVDALIFGISRIPDVPESILLELKREAANGTGSLYRKLLKVDSVAASGINVNDRQRIIRALAVYEATGMPISSFWNRKMRPDWDPLFIVTDYKRTLLYDSINNRVDRMIDEGLVDEVTSLIAKGYSERLKKTIGYAEIFSMINGELQEAEAIARMKQITRKYAKRQITWFSRYEALRYDGPLTGLSGHVKKYIKAHMTDGGIS